MDSKERLLTLKSEIEKRNEERQKNLGRLDAAMAELKKYNCDTVEEAEEYLDDLTIEKQELEDKITKELDSIEDELKNSSSQKST